MHHHLGAPRLAFNQIVAICRTPSPTCPTCGDAPETVAHYFLHCLTCSVTCANISVFLGCSRRTLRDLPNTRKWLKLLFRFVNATRRFQHTFSTFQDLSDDFDYRHPEGSGEAQRWPSGRGRRQDA